MKKILVVTKNWVGDILFEFPAIEVIKKHHPDSEIACIGPKRCHPILENHPAIDRVIEFDEKTSHRSILSRLKFIWNLRKEKWDQSYLFHRSRTRAFILYLAGVKERFGFNGGRRLFLTQSVEEPKPEFHQVDHFLKLFSGLGMECPEKPPYRFFYTPEQDESVVRILDQQKLKHFVCFHLGANWEPKRWPAAHFGKLADLIWQKWKLDVVVTGADRDEPLFEEMSKSVTIARVVSLVGKTSLGELGALFKRAQFMVSADSGPMHVASGVGARVVGLFGPTNADFTGPRGIGESVVIKCVPPGYQSPWYGKEPPKEWMSLIAPEEVIKVVDEKEWMENPVAVDEIESLSPAVRRASIPLAKKQSILVVTLSNVGDVILTTPVIMALAKSFPQARLTVVTSPRAEGVLKGSRYIDKIVIYDKRLRGATRWDFFWELRKQKYDYVVDLRNTLIPYLVKTKKRSPLIRLFPEKPFPEKHLIVLERMGIPTSDISPFDFYHSEDERSVLPKLKDAGVITSKDWIVIAPAAASELKTWKLEGFREVLRKLLKERSEEILLVGDKRERLLIDSLVALDPLRVHNIAGQTSLRELASVVSKAALVLSNDSAVMHLGYELDRPVVAIFGPTDYRKYGRVGPHFKIVREEIFCSPCAQPVCRFERQACFEDLTAEKVFQACKDLLRENIPAH